MTDLQRRLRHRVVLAGLALVPLLGIGAAGVQAYDNLPCSSRRTKNDCVAECTTENYLLECSCLFDDLDGNSQTAICQPGLPCCFDMPCEKWDGTSVYECLRGGGSLDGITPKNCGWSPEEGGGTCGCVPPLVHGDYTLEDLFVTNPNLRYTAPFGCRCPFTTDEQWLRLGVCNPPGVTKLQIKLNFAKSSMDGIDLKGTLAVPDGFSPAGATLQVTIGGVARSFTLDTKGKAKVGTDQAQVFVKKKKSLVLAQDARLTVKFAKGSFAESLADEGLADATVTEAPVTIPVEVVMNGTTYAKAQPQLYSAKQGKTGKTK